jgi:hypothetical protein
VNRRGFLRLLGLGVVAGPSAVKAITTTASPAATYTMVVNEGLTLASILKAKTLCEGAPVNPLVLVVPLRSPLLRGELGTFDGGVRIIQSRPMRVFDA